MAVEARRGCGYRKIGGTYLVSDPGGIPCDRLPFPLTVCPVCSCGIKQTRGWTWVNAKALFGGAHDACSDWQHRAICPVCSGTIERAGLLWIGEKFYKTPGDFLRESDALGVSRRITAVPRGFKVGETWVLFAHPKACTIPAEPCGEWIDGGQNRCTQVEGHDGAHRCLAIDVDTPLFKFTPGIFQVWKPQRIEKILPESARESDEVKELEEKGITPVFVPDDDKDHQGSVYDKDEPTRPEQDAANAEMYANEPLFDEDELDEEPRAFYPGDEVALADAIDSYQTRTPAHPFDGDEMRLAEGIRPFDGDEIFPEIFDEPQSGAGWMNNEGVD